jgi:protein O-GlcNAc transferase
LKKIQEVIINLLKQSKNEEAIEISKQAIEKKPTESEYYNLIALAYMFINNNAASIESINKALNLEKKSHFYSNKSLILMQVNNFTDAVIAADQAIEINTKNHEAFHNKSLALVRLKKYSEAIEPGMKAIELEPRLHQAYTNVGVAYSKIGLLKKSIEYYEKSLEIEKNNLDVLNNLSVAYIKLNKNELAKKYFNEALELGAISEDLYINIGMLNYNQNQFNEALVWIKKTLDINQNNSIAWFNLGNIFYKIGKYYEAIRSFENCKKINKNYKGVSGNILHMKMFIAEWKDIEYLSQEVKNEIGLGNKTASPFSLLSYIDDPQIIYENAIVNSNENLNKNITIEKKEKVKEIAKEKERINIAYFSSDFKRHPVTYLMLDVLKNHSREKFVVFAYSYSHNYSDDYTDKVKEVVDHWIDIKHLSDDEIEENIKKNDIDIIIDLNGWTEGYKSLLHKKKLAFLQINMLGFPSTMGNNNYDYIIADEFVIPKEYEKYYSEKVIKLSNFQPRAELICKIEKIKNENNGVVFGCYNNIYKITPEIFNAWIKILNTITNSRLILFSSSAAAEENLLAYAGSLGVSSTRITFKKKKKYEEYLESYNEIDLFLDTYPFGAGTTASDSIYMNTPIVTLAGKVFTSRMAASLLNNLDLSELICYSIDEYINKIIQLANDKALLNNIKFQIENCKNNLFSNGYVYEFENSILDAYKAKAVDYN